MRLYLPKLEPELHVATKRVRLTEMLGLQQVAALLPSMCKYNYQPMPCCGQASQKHSKQNAQTAYPEAMRYKAWSDPDNKFTADPVVEVAPRGLDEVAAKPSINKVQETGAEDLMITNWYERDSVILNTANARALKYC